MIIITQPRATEEQIERIVARVREFGLEPHISRGASRVIIGVVGPEDLAREKPLAAMPGVEAIVPVLKPYKLASSEFHGEPSTVSIGNVPIGALEKIALISGPCSVESRDQILSIARTVKESEPAFCAAAPLNRALRLTASRVYARMDCVFWPKRASKPGCPSSPKSWTRAIWA